MNSLPTPHRALLPAVHPCSGDRRGPRPTGRLQRVILRAAPVPGPRRVQSTLQGTLPQVGS